jgi:hypothetical protein
LHRNQKALKTENKGMQYYAILSGNTKVITITE